MTEKPWTDKEKFEELYIGQDLSIYEMADEWGCSHMTVYNWKVKLGVEDKFIPPAHQFKKKGDSVGATYEQVANYYDGDMNRVLVHRLIAVAKGDLDPSNFCDGSLVVHHESRHGLDNRHDNLHVIDEAEHARLHQKNMDKG